MALTTITNAMVSVNAIQGTLIADNAITAVHIATNAVSGTLIADNAITATHIAQNSITVTQLADDCVESDKIADGIITTNHLNKAMISSQTEVAVATGDFVLLGDTSDSNNLKKAPISSILAGTLTTAAQTNITSVGTLTGLTVSYSGTGNLVELISTDAGSSTAPDLSFYRNSSSPADNDNIGLIRFYGNDDGGNKTSYAAIHAYIADASDGSSDGGLIFSTTRADTQAPTGAAESLRITETGKVGIGTSSPARNLVVSSSGQTDVAIVAGTSASAQLQFGDSGDDNIGQIEYNNSTNNMVFYANATEHMRINSNGNINIGIGGSGGDLLLQPLAKLYLDAGGNTYIQESAGDVIDIFTGGAQRLRLNSSGASVTGTVTQDGAKTKFFTGQYDGRETNTITLGSLGFKPQVLFCIFNVGTSQHASWGMAARDGGHQALLDYKAQTGSDGYEAHTTLFGRLAFGSAVFTNLSVSSWNADNVVIQKSVDNSGSSSTCVYRITVMG